MQVFELCLLSHPGAWAVWEPPASSSGLQRTPGTGLCPAWRSGTDQIAHLEWKHTFYSDNQQHFSMLQQDTTKSGSSLPQIPQWKFFLRYRTKLSHTHHTHNPTAVSFITRVGLTRRQEASVQQKQSFSYTTVLTSWSLNSLFWTSLLHIRPNSSHTTLRVALQSETKWCIVPN